METQLLRCAIAVGLVLSGCGRSELLGPLELELGPIAEPPPRVCAGGTRGTPLLDFIGAWAGGCIDVEYTDELPHEVPMLRRALAAWATPVCTSVCFSSPQPFSGRPNTRRILLDQDNGILRSADGVIGVFHGNVPGRSSVREMAVIVRRRETQAKAEDYLSAVGSALSFLATPGVDSALDGSRATLSEADVQSVCALYPCN